MTNEKQTTSENEASATDAVARVRSPLPSLRILPTRVRRFFVTFLMPPEHTIYGVYMWGLSRRSAEHALYVASGGRVRSVRVREAHGGIFTRILDGIKNRFGCGVFEVDFSDGGCRYY